MKPPTICYLSRAEVVRAAAELDPVPVVRTALELHAEGRTTLPDEAYLPWHTSDGAAARSLALPAALWGGSSTVGLKVINGCLSNPDRGLPRAQGLTLLFDREHAHPVAVMEAAYLSALRTSAYSALSVRILGPPAPDKVAVIGCGVLGEAHVRMLAPRLPHSWFALYDHVPARRDALVAAVARDGVDGRAAGSIEAAVRDAGIVVTVTTTTAGYLPFEWLCPGALVAHVSLDDVRPDVVARADLVVVDDWHLVSSDGRRLLGRLYRSGDLVGPNTEAFGTPRPAARRVDATLGDVLTGRHPGRGGCDQIVLSNPFGMGILDVALAAEVLRRAERLGLGTSLPV